MTCPGCGAPLRTGFARCASCGASGAHALVPGRPLPPPVPPAAKNGDRPLVTAGSRSSAGGSRSGALRLDQPPTLEITRPDLEPARPYDVDLERWSEDRRGRSLVLPTLVGAVATVLTIIGLIAVGEDKTETVAPSPDAAAPTTLTPDAADAAAPPAAAVEGGSTLPTVPISAIAPVTTAAAPAPPAAAAPSAAATQPAAAPGVGPVAGAPPAGESAAATPSSAPVVAPAPTPDQIAATHAQELATALAAGDWDLARRVNPAIAEWSDEEFEEGYGDLAASTVVPVRADEAGENRIDLRLGLVAHQQADGARRTTIYCVTWRVDAGAGTVGQQGTADVMGTRAGWVDPAEVSGEIRSAC